MLFLLLSLLLFVLILIRIVQMWVTMTSVVTDRLVTDEKKQWLTDANIASYRDVLEKSGILSSVDGVIDGE